ncbi:MAG: NTP transferase domain-containing protein [Bacteroidia bacterium]|nr:NTP transferase domain-containing protein [Bacteroidia bacterium]
MKIIVPMAGMGKRMRPHTLTVPKPLIPVAGKSIVQHLMEDLIAVCPEPVDEIAYVVGRFGTEAENNLINIAQTLGAKGSIYYQDEPLGTAHAILCAKPALTGKVIVAFADTLFTPEDKISAEAEGVIWVKKIEDPRQFGVVNVNAQGIITEFVEKPQHFVSDLAIIGIYYFKDGDNLKNELQYLLDNNIKDKGEFQLTNAMENMKNKGLKLLPGKVAEWLDCGNKDATVYTNQRVLELKYPENHIAADATITDSVIIPPCFIGTGATVTQSVIGPHVSIGAQTKVEQSIIKNSIIQTQCNIKQAAIANSMMGNNVLYKGQMADVSLGDYSVNN